MGDRAGNLAKAKKELEDLYLGVPDDSVNLTFQDFAQVRQDNKKKLSPSNSAMPPIVEKSPLSSPVSRLPSLDFSKGLEASYQSHHHHNQNHQYTDHGVEQRSMAGYDDMSVAYGAERGGRRRPGIPHSNICAICCNYIYIYRHRCLVCGRVYCRQCVSDGMGEMIEGRKCIDCLGRRFSQRYIHKAGNVGCCMGYPTMVKKQELKWAERGARKSGESRYGNSIMTSGPGSRSPMGPGPTSRSPVGPGPGTPSRQQHSPSNPPSFVMNSPYSPYTPTNHHPMPF